MLQAMRNPKVQRLVWGFIIFTFVAVFIFAETSGLLGRSPVTRGTTVGKVNGQEITYDQWIRYRENQIRRAQEQRGGLPLSLDDTKRIEDQAWDDMVNDILLSQEITRRHLGASDQEIVDASQYMPPPEFRQNPEFQTEGRFDMQKYQRFLRSPIAKQQGALAALEGYYRTELPKEKLFEQVASTVYVPDSQLWWMWQIQHDSAQATFASWTADSIADAAVTVSDADIQHWFDQHKSKLENRPGRAVFTVTRISRVPTAFDSAATRARAVALRDSILKGAKFEDVAKRESVDSGSAVQGGSLGKTTKGKNVAEFDNAAFALTPGQISEPVLTQFGYHLIKVDSKNGDTIDVRHILLKVQQSDSSATRVDKLADLLSKATANAELPAKFDAAVKELGLPVMHGTAAEGEPLQANGHFVPSVSAWAFGGTAKAGESSDLFENEDGYYLARLDTLVLGGKPDVKAMTPDIRKQLALAKKVDMLLPKAKQVASAVAGGQTLEAAATAAGRPVHQTPMFTRTSAVQGVGQVNEAIGTAFGLASGAVSNPVKTDRGVYVLRVDKRIAADRTEWEKQKTTQRQQMMGQARQQRVREFLASLRESAKIQDDRKTIAERSRGAGA
ncbi:MAG: peptidylprolyl isomerase [Gemmatimonadaceae bacterium]